MHVCVGYFVCNSFGSVSNALLMSTVERTVHFGGFLLLKPSKVFCVRFMRKVVVEWFGLNLCWVCQRGM